MTLVRRFKPHLVALARHRAGTGARVAGGLYIDRNERAVPFPSEVQAALIERLSRVPVNQYPEMGPLYRRLAAWTGLAENQLFVTEGVSGAIKALIETLAVPGDNVVFPTPSFALYPVYAAMHATEGRPIGYRGYRLDLDALLDAIDDRTAVVFLPNPNVPIESPFDLDTLAAIADRCAAQGACLAVDEVYFPFGGPTALPLIDRFENLVVLRSFSKAFGLAGIRVGYICGQPALVDYVSKVRTGYETNALSAEAACFFMDMDAVLHDYVAQVKDGFRIVKGELGRLGVAHNGGETSNFLYIDLGSRERAAAVVAALRGNGIFVRGGWAAPFDGGFSITGAPVPEMERFLSAFRDAWL